MKNLKKVLALVLAVVMIMGTVAVASAKDYSDVKDDNDYAVAIDVLSNLGILDGFPSGEFKPEGLLTRAEAAKIVAIVHNSAIMGSVQSDVADLYKNAQNSFVDCNNSWALPYINYCRITGLADGMTTTTYEPNRKLTGVQFLKLMLTTLNFDSAKEGFTGKGWDVNVLRRANEVGLTDGLADGWQGINELKRGEAAQILYNALTKYLVEYGQLVKNNYVNSVAASDTTAAKDGYYKSSFISNEQVAKSGYTLAAKMKVSVTYTTDAFRRPGYKWSYKSWSKFYMDTPINSYTNAVTMCDILKNDLGVAETKSTTTALGYLAVDGYKVTATDADKIAFAELLPLPDSNVQYAALAHDGGRNCQDKTFGCQGTLTQVFELAEDVDGAEAGDPVITEIHTFLSEVTSVAKSTRVTHAKGEVTGMKVWTYLGIDMPLMLDSENFSYWYEVTEHQTTSGAKYDVGTKLNVTISLKAAQNAEKPKKYVYDNETYLDYAKGSVIDVNEPETKVGKLTGASDLKYPETVSVDGTQYYTNCKFIYGKELAMNFANRNNTFKFYYDSYGNVIGCDTNTAASEYVVMDRIYGEHVKGKFVLKADLYDLTGKKIEDATISTAAGSFKDFTGDWDNMSYTPIGFDDIYTDADRNDPAYTDALYTYSVDNDGVYTLTWTGLFDYDGDYWDGFSRISTDPDEERDVDYNLIQHIAKRASISVFTDSEMLAVNVTESTKFICKGVNGEWKAYTGYTELPALTAQYMDYVMEDDNFASVVYLGEVIYAADKIVGYVPTWKAFNWSGNYDVITVYVKGEAVKVNILHDDQPVDLNRDPGVYEFTMAVDKDGVAYATYKKAQFPTLYLNGTVAQGSDKSAIIVIPEGTGVDPDLNEYPAIGLTGVSIYLVKGNTVTAMDKADILVGDYVQIYMDADGEITEIYVIEY